MTQKKTNDIPEQKSDAVLKLYRERLGVLKKAQEHSAKGEVAKAVERYQFYLKSLATYYNTEEPKLRPSLFDSKKDLSELLLISHVYWDLAKAYDRAPKLRKEFLRCLDQFALFTMGFKFQHVNSRMVRKFMRKKSAHNPQAFKQTLEKIQVDSKGCFVATYAYGDQHPITESLRRFKKNFSVLPCAPRLIELYYWTSPKMIRFFEGRPIIYRLFYFLFLHPLCSTLFLFYRNKKPCSSLKN